VALGVTKTLLYDFDGDHVSDIWIRTDQGAWYLDYSSNGFGVWDEVLDQYGYRPDAAGCPADYDHDGLVDTAILDNAAMALRIDYAADGFGSWNESIEGYGGPACQPVMGDYDGDGWPDLAVYDSINRTWSIDGSNDGFHGWNWSGNGLGTILSVPCPGDYDGDGLSDVSLRTEVGLWIIDYRANGFGVIDWSGQYPDSLAPVMTCPGDYDGDVKTDIAVVDNETGEWYVDLAHNGFGSWDNEHEEYGAEDAVVMEADYDGDGRCDIARYRTDEGSLCFDLSSTGFGGWDDCFTGYSSEAPTDELVPAVLALSNCYPNPFVSREGATSLHLALPSTASVQLSVYDIQGRRVRTVELGERPAGMQLLTWNGRSDQGNFVPSGMYIMSCTTQNRTLNRRITVVK
jgi:hypothetical protein